MDELREQSNWIIEHVLDNTSQKRGGGLVVKASTWAEVARRIAAFAASEADRRERECIEAVCVECAVGSVPVREDPKGIGIWYHKGDQYDPPEPSHCNAGSIYERSYRREQREKEKAT